MPHYELPFKMICDTSDIAVGALLGETKNKMFHTIYYASKTLDAAHANNNVIEKEMFALVYAFD